MPKAVEIALRECFHPKEGRPDLRKIPVNIERAKQHIDKAHSNLPKERRKAPVFRHGDIRRLARSANN